MNKDKEVEVVDSRGRGRSYGEGSRFDNFVQDECKFEWKNDDKDKSEWKGASSY